MDIKLKRRLAGGAVLVLLAVIFVPMLFEDALQHEASTMEPFPAQAVSQPQENAALPSVSAGPPASAAPKIPLPSTWAVQVGSFSSPDNARALVAQLKAKGFAAFVVQPAAGGKPLYRVRVGPVLEKERAAALGELIHKQTGLKGFVVSHP